MLTCILLISTAARRATTSGAPPPQHQCNTGVVQCCNTVGQAKDGDVIEQLLTLLGLAVDDNTMVGLSCSPITVIGVGGSQWYMSLLLSRCKDY
jgi:hypothetical protein